VSVPAMASVTGGFALGASGVDVYGNPGGSAGPVLSVTRRRWQVPLSQLGALSSVTEPAMDTAGNVYVAFASGTFGQVTQVRPDGGLGWVQTGYGAVTAPAVWSPNGNPDGGPGLFVATRLLSQAQVRLLDVTGGGETSSEVCTFNTTYSARMLSLGRTVVTAREVTATQQQLYLADPSGGNCNSNGTVAVTGRATVVGRQQVDGTTEVYAGSTGISGFFRLTVSDAGTQWIDGTNTLGTPTFIGSLALSSTRGFLTPNGPNRSEGVIASNLSSQTPATVSALLSPGMEEWTGATLRRATGNQVEVYFGNAGGTSAARLHLTQFTPQSLPMTGTFAPNMQAAAARDAFSAVSFTPAHAPILTSGGGVLMVSRTGAVSFLDRQGMRQWVAADGDTGFGAVSVSPVLDVSRTRPVCQAPGTLYVLSNDGVLTAFIVDARGLDSQADWPRFQHDNANSGNASTALTPWACP
ncbi:MAG: hypothetical protein SFW67_09515, partial [Myxococcaceae bacterium]|nr:hypothetical protein [Myxococcaceae bacterium]